MKYALILLLLSANSSAQTFKDTGIKIQPIDILDLSSSSCNYPQVSFIVHNDSTSGNAHLIVYKYDMFTSFTPAVTEIIAHYNAQISVYSVTPKGAIMVGVPFMGIYVYGGCSTDADPADHVRKAYSFTVRKETHK